MWNVLETFHKRSQEWFSFLLSYLDQPHILFDDSPQEGDMTGQEEHVQDDDEQLVAD